MTCLMGRGLGLTEGQCPPLCHRGSGVDRATEVRSQERRTKCNLKHIKSF